MKRIKNTAKEEINPGWTMGGAPDQIEAQEARGQRQLANSQQLPCDVRGDKASLEAAGVIFGPQSPGDRLFCDATLPPGWKIKPTDHSMWSDLIDDTGKKRASIFYKAAFYDRSAFMNVGD